MKAVVMLMIMTRHRLSNDGSVIWIRDVSRPPVKQQRPLIMLILYHTDIQWDLHISRTCTHSYVHKYLVIQYYKKEYITRGIIVQS